MKLRYFSIIPLLVLCGCTDKSGIAPHNQNEQDVYTNVYYFFEYESHSYIVYLDENDENTKKIVPPSNYYVVNYSILFVENEYFVKTNELFVYTK